MAAAVAVGMEVAYGRLLVSGAVNIHLADFVTYYSSSQLVIGGRGKLLYNFAALGHAQAQLTYPLRMPGGVGPFIYPPWFALVVAPLSLLPYTTAYVVWFLGNAVLALVALLGLALYAGLDRLRAVLLVLLGLSFLPVFAAFGQGQVSLMLLALLTGVLWALRARYEAAAGILLALVLVKPQYALPIVGVLALQRRWRACFSVAGCAALLVLVPLPFLGGGIEGQYVKSLIHLSTLHGSAGYMAPPVLNYSLQGFTELVLPAHSALARLLLEAALLLLAVGVALRQRASEIPVALALLFGLLASPHVLIYDVSLLVLPLVVLCRQNGSWSILAGLAYAAPLVGQVIHLGVLATVAAMGVTAAALGFVALKSGLTPTKVVPVATGAPFPTD